LPPQVSNEVNLPLVGETGDAALVDLILAEVEDDDTVSARGAIEDGVAAADFAATLFVGPGPRNSSTNRSVVGLVCSPDFVEGTEDAGRRVLEDSAGTA